MFGRPRCREWTPLVTQQLRLRSLIQIVGYNIRPPEGCASSASYYITLHHTTMSAPFYTSERISSPHPKWKEIDSEITQRMSSTNIVIRIWCHTLNENNSKDTKHSEDSIDTVIQTWGVYFSGLRYIGANLASKFTAECFKTNTLVFQMHGGYFCSYKSLKIEVIHLENETEHSSLSSDSSGKTSKSPYLDFKSQFNHKLVKNSRSISPNMLIRKNEKDCSKSQSPVEKFKQNFPTMRTSTSLNIDRNRKDTNEEKEYIYEHSPESLESLNCDIKESNKFSSQIDVSETAESYDFEKEECRVPKYRYLRLNFLKSELRPSYNGEKLQRLHLLQYSIKKKQESVQEIKKKIYSKSATDSIQGDLELSKPKFRRKSQISLFEIDDSEVRSQVENRNNNEKDEKRVVSSGPRLTLKLNDLLSYKAKPSPQQLAEHLRLTKQLEILRFKRIILSDERDSKLANIRRLKETYSKLFEENQDMGTELMQKYHSLSRSNEDLKQERKSCAALREIAANTHWLLAAVRAELLAQLAGLFYIEKLDQSTWSIINVPLPICGDEGTKPPTLSDAVAAGYAAQCLAVISSIIGLPLRYQLFICGSHSKIVDITPDLPEPSMPLYPVSGEVNLFKYAMFLLNKNILQLMFACGLHLLDMKPTLSNLHRLMTNDSNAADTLKLYGTYRPHPRMMSPRTQSLRSLVACERGKQGRQFNRFKESVDGQTPSSSVTVQRHKHTRSDGGYRDEHKLSALNTSTASVIGSEPNIYTDLAKENSNVRYKSLKTHGSDSQLDKAVDSTDKVAFTIGDTEFQKLDEGRLVKISTNNGDTASGSYVKDICEEINSYCAIELNEIDKRLGVMLDQQMEAINEDMVKYIESRMSIVEDSKITDSGIDFDENLQSFNEKLQSFGETESPEASIVVKETKMPQNIEKILIDSSAIDFDKIVQRSNEVAQSCNEIDDLIAAGTCLDVNETNISKKTRVEISQIDISKNTETQSEPISNDSNKQNETNEIIKDETNDKSVNS